MKTLYEKSFLKDIKKVKNQKILQFLIDEIYKEPEDIEIPKKYKSMISYIADSISAGLVCFINVDTLEVEDVTKLFLEDPEEFEAMTGETGESMELKHLKWENYLEVRPPESHESVQYIEDFIEKISEQKLQQKLVSALNRKSPFANFRNIIDNSKYRQDWFDYRQERLEEYVFEIISDVLNMNN